MDSKIDKPLEDIFQNSEHPEKDLKILEVIKNIP